MPKKILNPFFLNTTMNVSEKTKELNEKKKQPHYGEEKCQHTGCNNGAYYVCQMPHAFLCGVHSRKRARTELKKMDAQEREKRQSSKIQSENEIIEALRLDNVKHGRTGKVVVSNMKMMKPVMDIEGFRKVFPNFRHQSRKDGFGCSSLSPMSLGPVAHGQPGVIDALNIENFHQGSKCFEEELQKDTDEPSPTYFSNRDKFYADPVPHRHKFIGTDKKNKNIPKFFLWLDKNSKYHKLTYIESRQFYCHFYERLASKQEDFRTLQKMIKDGYNLQICGYDGRNVGHRSMNEEYLDPSKPFGHELVLYVLLTESNPSNYPWRKNANPAFWS